jgi:hypothetical protein
MADWSCITSLSLGCSGVLYYVVTCYALSAPSGGCVVTKNVRVRCGGERTDLSVVALFYE